MKFQNIANDDVLANNICHQRCKRCVGYSLKEKVVFKRCFHSFSQSSQAGYLRLLTGFNQSQSCREFTFQYKGLLYCISLRLRQQSLKYFFLCDLKPKGEIVLIITAHAANNGWDIFSRRILPYEIQTKLVQNRYFEALQLCTHEIKAQYLGRSNYCTQNRRVVKTDNTLPELKTRKQIARLLEPCANFQRSKFLLNIN